jgi:gamma-carbonic anhydrase
MTATEARVFSFRGVRPVIGNEVFLAPGTLILGDVILGEQASIWYHAVVRGDINFIRVGRGTNLQDLSMIHVTEEHPVRIGDGVTVGHSAVIHGATLEDGCLLGMGAIVLDGARIGEGAMVAAGALVPPGMEIPPRMLALGSPARIKRALTPEEGESIRQSALRYEELARLHVRELGLGEDPAAG